MSIKPMTAQEVKAKMIALHHELGNFLFYLTMNSGTLPRRADEEDQEAIEYVMERLEKEVERIAKADRNHTIDELVLKSLEQAGFHPDSAPKDPPATDSK